MVRLLAVLLAVGFSIQLATAQNPDFLIEDSPSWKKKIPFEIADRDVSMSGETSYLLLDWQENEVLQEYNYRFCVRLNNENGVQNNSQLYLSFDPSYQELAINKVLLHRNGKEINQLVPDRIEVMRNEKNIDRLLYDGTYSALIILNDVRVNDVLEYEYTLKGKNPILGDHFYTSHQLAYNEQIDHLYKRSILPSTPTPQYTLYKEATPPSVEIGTQQTIYEWNLKNVNPIFADNNLPSWYKVYPSCEISSFRNWQEVKAWERNLFNFQISTPTIDRYLKELDLPKQEESILKLIRFVQDDIRYLGMEMGEYSHKPHHPEKIFKQRFGDCKDKSYLLAVLLQKIGVQAWPALVNTVDLGHIDTRIPSPFVFNHVIVKFSFNDKNYWIDPTVSQQKGSLEHLCFPEVGKVLVVDNEQTDLEEVPLQKQDRVAIQEHYWMKDSASEVSYQVITNYYGNFANMRRSSFKNRSYPEIRDSYINFYSGYMNNVSWETDSSLAIQDYPEVNNFKTTEDYTIQNLWEQRNENDPDFYATFQPFNMYEYLSYSKDKDRTMPLFIYHPLTIDHTISIHLPRHKDISLTNESDSIVNSAFRFLVNTEVDRTSHIYRINYSYETLSDHVPVEQLENYFNDYDRLSTLCEVNLNWGIGSGGNFRLFLPALIAAFLFIGLMIYGLTYLYKNDLNLTQSQASPIPFGGWLILPIIGLHLSPILVSYQLFNINYFNRTLWENVHLIDPSKQFILEAAYFFELFFNLALIVFAIFLLMMLYQKRTTFPTLYIWFRAVALILLLFDLTVVADLFNTEIDYKRIAQEIIYAAIWIPYFWFSSRVQDTFVNPYTKPEQEHSHAKALTSIDQTSIDTEKSGYNV